MDERKYFEDINTVKRSQTYLVMRLEKALGIAVQLLVESRKVVEHTAVEHIVTVKDHIFVFGEGPAVAVIRKDGTDTEILFICPAFEVIIVVGPLHYGIADFCILYLDVSEHVAVLRIKLLQRCKLMLKFRISARYHRHL